MNCEANTSTARSDDKNSDKTPRLHQSIEGIVTRCAMAYFEYLFNEEWLSSWDKQGYLRLVEKSDVSAAEDLYENFDCTPVDIDDAAKGSRAMFDQAVQIATDGLKKRLEEVKASSLNKNDQSKTGKRPVTKSDSAMKKSAVKSTSGVKKKKSSSSKAK